MTSSTTILVTSLIGLTIYFLSTQIHSYILDRRFIRLHGCEPPLRLPQPERIIGWTLFKKRQENFRLKRIHQSVLERFATFGPTFCFWLFGQRFFQTMDPENVKTVLATRFRDFGIGRRKESYGMLLGSGIFTTDGTQWEHSRALIRPAFAKSQLTDLSLFERHIQALVSRIPPSNKTFDLQPLFFKLTLDTATEYLFGESIDSLLDTGPPAADDFATAFDTSQQEMLALNQLGPLAFFKSKKSLLRNCSIVHAHVDRFVFRCLEYRKNLRNQVDEKKEEGEKGGKEKYVFLNELAKATQDPQQLRDELLNMLLAGRDTTAGLLAHVFFWLARRPDVMEKLRKEVDELGGEPPDYETLRGMRYLRFVLNETLRLFPAVPLEARFAVTRTLLPHGGGPSGSSPVFIPPGTILLYAPYAMHRNAAIYGADALDFNPDRWDGLKVGWDYIPFNGGPRICVGQQFALTEAGYTTVRLVQEWKVVSRDEGEYVEAYSLTNLSGGGTWVGMERRNVVN